MIYIITAIIVIILLVVGGKMTKDQGYTIGKGMFKNSEHYFDEDNGGSKDASDFDYWNKDQLKQEKNIKFNFKLSSYKNVVFQNWDTTFFI